MSIASIDKLLSCLDKVIDLGNGKWMARCPSHEDKTPSLSIAETSDGFILIHCFASCGPGDVMAAIGLSLKDLYPDNHDHDGKQISRRPRWNAKDLLAALSFEFQVVLMAACDIVAGKKLTDEDVERVADALKRVQRIQEICGV